MDDNQLKVYIPQYGDRLALRFWISQNSSTNTVVDEASCSSVGKRKETVIERLRKKLRLDQYGHQQSFDVDATCSSPEVGLGRVPRGKSNSNAVKGERLIEICWTNVECDGLRRTIKTKEGGGVRKLPVPTSSASDDLCSLAIDLFFPNQISKLGKKEEFEYKICTFTQEVMRVNVTVGDMYKTSKLPILRFYLQTTAKSFKSSFHVPATITSSDQSDDDFLPDIVFHRSPETNAVNVDENYTLQRVNLNESSRSENSPLNRGGTAQSPCIETSEEGPDTLFTSTLHLDAEG